MGIDLIIAVTLGLLSGSKSLQCHWHWIKYSREAYSEYSKIWKPTWVDFEKFATPVLEETVWNGTCGWSYTLGSLLCLAYISYLVNGW